MSNIQHDRTISVLLALMMCVLCSGQNCARIRSIPPADPDEVHLGVSPCGSALFPAPDSDLDGLCDPIDNGPTLFNPDQVDEDGDGVGDKCELSVPDKLAVELTAEVIDGQIQVSAAVTGGTEPYTYQWAVNPNPVGFSPFAPFVDPGSPDVIWSPPCGQAFVLTLTVNDDAIPVQLAVESTGELIVPCSP
jgi:hypothetical protein